MTINLAKNGYNLAKMIINFAKNDYNLANWKFYVLISNFEAAKKPEQAARTTFTTDSVSLP
jgi:TPP-dependent 2-oxoacid decarboxylase